MRGNGHGEHGNKASPSLPHGGFNRLLAELRPKQAEFVRQYVLDHNATQAAIRAGYSKRGAEVQGHHLLRNPKIKNALRQIESQLATQTQISASAVIRELARVGMSDLRNYLGWGPKGLRIKDSKELTEGQARAIAQVKETRKVIPVRFGEPIVETTITFKLHDKKGALDSLAKHLGMFRDSERSVTAEQLDALLKAILSVLEKFLPPDQVEPAIHEFGRQTDIAYERLSGARA